MTPAIASALGDVLVEAGIPKGVFNHVFVPGAVAAKLVSDPRVKALSFTGSTGVGRKLAIDAATSSTRLQLEMGGEESARGAGRRGPESCRGGGAGRRLLRQRAALHGIQPADRKSTRLNSSH